MPLQVKQHRKVLLEKCLGALREPVSTSVTAEGMEALTKILAELREGDVGSSFDAMSEQCRIFFDNVSPMRASMSLFSEGVGTSQTLRNRRALQQKERRLLLGASVVTG